MWLHYLFDTPVWLLAPALVMAMVIDRLFGEPPQRLHPVTWMGNYLAWAGKQWRRVAEPDAQGHAGGRALLGGILAWTVGALLVLLPALAIQMLLHWVPSAVLLALCLKPMLAWSTLRGDVIAVERALSAQTGGTTDGTLEAGRDRLHKFVGRDVGALDETGVRESAIVALAENLNRTVVAPIFWWVLLGLPGAVLYRFANTANLTWGHPGVVGRAQSEWLGLWVARSDNVLGWLPARITGVLLWLLAPGARAPWRQCGSEAAKVPSPNNGFAIATMALTLGITLGSSGVYRLNPEGASPTREDTRAAVALASKSVAIAVLLACATILGVAALGLDWGQFL